MNLDVIGNVIDELSNVEPFSDVPIDVTLDIVGYSYDFRSVFGTTELFPTALCYHNVQKTLKIIEYALEILKDTLSAVNKVDTINQFYFILLYLPSLYIRPLTLDISLGCLCEDCKISNNLSTEEISNLYKHLQKTFKDVIKDLDAEGDEAKEVVISDPVVRIARLSERVYSADRLVELEDVEIDRLIVRDNQSSPSRGVLNENPEFNRYNFKKLSDSISSFVNQVLENETFLKWSTKRNEMLAIYNEFIYSKLEEILSNFRFKVDYGLLFKPTPTVYNVYTPYEILMHDIPTFMNALSDNVFKESKDPIFDVDITKVLLRTGEIINKKQFTGPLDNSNFINIAKFYNNLKDTMRIVNAHEFIDAALVYYSSKTIKEFIKTWKKGSVTENEEN